MKKSSFLALALAPMILGAPIAATAQSVSTDPVGFIKTNATPDALTALGLPMVNPALHAGLISGVAGETLTVNADVAALPAGPHYIEIVDDEEGGALIGDRFDVASVDGADITLAVGGDSFSTMDVVPAGLLDAQFVLRRHLTFGQLADFLADGDSFNGHGNPNLADQIQLYRDGGFLTHHFNGSAWVLGGTVATDSVIDQGEGIFFRRRAGDLELVNLGEVRSSDFRQPLTQGLSLVGMGYPMDLTPEDRNFSVDGGFTAHGNPNLADQIQVWADGGFTTYHLSAGSTWGTFAEFDAGSSVFVRKRSDDTAFVTLRPY